MGVWSSIRSASKPEQILSFDPDAFSQSLLKDVRKVKIQESLSQTHDCTSSVTEERKLYSTNFEYSMGGNLKFYKEHFMKDYLAAKSCIKSEATQYSTPGFSGRQQRNRSISDHDSDPEALRFPRRHQTRNINLGTAEYHSTADLSFDHYTTIYQPEFLLKVPSQPAPLLHRHLRHEDHVIQDVLEDHVVIEKATKDFETKSSLERDDDQGSFEERIIQSSRRNNCGKSIGKPKREYVDTRTVVTFPTTVVGKDNRHEIEYKDRILMEAQPAHGMMIDEKGSHDNKYSDTKNMHQKKSKMRLVETLATDRRRCNLQVSDQKDKAQQGVQSEKQSPENEKVERTFSFDIKQNKEVVKVKTAFKIPINRPKSLVTRKDNKEETLSDRDDYLIEENTHKKNELLLGKHVISGSRKKITSKEKTNKTLSIENRTRNDFEITVDEKYNKISAMKKQNKKPVEYNRNVVGNKSLDLERAEQKNSNIDRQVIKTNIADDNDEEDKDTSSRSISLSNLSLKIPLEENHDRSGNSKVIEGSTEWFSPISKKETQFYAASQTEEANFHKTSSGTGYNSMDSLSDCEDVISPQQNDKNEECKDPPGTNQYQLVPESKYSRLPKEFQEMARRLSKTGELPCGFKPRPSLYQVTSLPSNYSSSTNSSPRSPSARTLSRTPSYKMPKTPSLSRQHPATYVTQHTSSRSKPSSRVSSRAPSPTRDYYSDAGWPSLHTFI